METQYGLPAEHASMLAKTQTQIERQLYQERQSKQQITQGAQAKLEMVADLADRHGLSFKEAKTLMRYNSPQEMQMGAQILASQRRAQSSQDATIKALQEQVAKLTQAAPQIFDSGQGAVAAGGDQQLISDYAQGRIGFTPQVREAQKRLGML